MKLTFIIPCYNEEKNINIFFSDLVNSFKNKKYDIELIFINDGSTDNTLYELKKLLKNSFYEIKIINFSRNFGKEAGIYAGLKNSSGDYVVLIDADMQQPPSLVLDMIKCIQKDDSIDIVAYYQSKRRENKIVSFFKSSFYKIIAKLSGLDFHNNASDFRLLKRNVVDAILKFFEHNRFSKGIFAWVGFNTYYLPYVPEKRAYGNTSWGFKQLFIYGKEGILSFIKSPLKIITKIGLLNIIFSFCWFIVNIINNFNSNNYIYIFLLFMFGLNFVFLGFIGEYIFRTYTESLNRPIYVEKEILTNEKNN